MVGTVKTGEKRVSVGKVMNTGDKIEEFADILGERSPCKPNQSDLCQCPRRFKTPTPPLPA